MGQFMLHLLVRSMFANAVGESISTFSPSMTTLTFSPSFRFSSMEFFSPVPSLAYFSASRYLAASDQYTSQNFPCSGHSFSMKTFPSFSKMVASRILPHSGQIDLVFLGRPVAAE